MRFALRAATPRQEKRVVTAAESPDEDDASPCAELWQRYRHGGDPEARTQLLDRHARLVHHLARQTSRRAGPDVELDDLVGAGMLGLVRALEAFDPARGLAFSTYAVPRIRGAILDELRARDWMPRSLRARARDISRVRAALEQTLERSPRATEVAAGIGVDLPTYLRLEALTHAREFVSIDQPGPDGLPSPGEVLCGSGPEADQVRWTQAEGLESLRDRIAELPEKDRLVLTFYYYEGLNLRQIGEILHVTESRVSQIRTRALAQLRERLAQGRRPKPRRRPRRAAPLAAGVRAGHAPVLAGVLA
jgi:RNA polymerase sigma factor FliA